LTWNTTFYYFYNTTYFIYATKTAKCIRDLIKNDISNIRLHQIIIFYLSYKLCWGPTRVKIIYVQLIQDDQMLKTSVMYKRKYTCTAVVEISLSRREGCNRDPIDWINSATSVCLSLTNNLIFNERIALSYLSKRFLEI